MILFFLVHGLICFGIISIPLKNLISQILGIGVLSTYYYNFIPLYKKQEIIDVYVNMCFWIALLGVLMFIFGINLNSPERLQSVFTEPFRYNVVIIPACLYFLKNKNYAKFIFIFITLILSGSSLGYIGCGLMILIPYLSFRKVLQLSVLIPIVCTSFYLIYQNSPAFKLRFDDTYNSFKAIETGKFQQDTNISSYALMSNLFVAKNNFLEHPFGSGLGSHGYMHKNVYYTKMRPPEFIKTLELQYINSQDASSLFIRLFSDLGLFGVLLICYFLYKAYGTFNHNDFFLEQGIFIFILLKLFRDGHYFSQELFFFIWIVYYSHKANSTQLSYKDL